MKHIETYEIEEVEIETLQTLSHKELQTAIKNYLKSKRNFSVKSNHQYNFRWGLNGDMDDIFCTIDQEIPKNQT